MEDKKALVLQKEIQCADLARKYQEIQQFPSSATMQKILAKNLVKNAVVNSDDLKQSLDLYGEPTPILKGK